MTTTSPPNLETSKTMWQQIDDNFKKFKTTSIRLYIIVEYFQSSTFDDGAWPHAYYLSIFKISIDLTLCFLCYCKVWQWRCCHSCLSLVVYCLSGCCIKKIFWKRRREKMKKILSFEKIKKIERWKMV